MINNSSTHHREWNELMKKLSKKDYKKKAEPRWKKILKWFKKKA